MTAASNPSATPEVFLKVKTSEQSRRYRLRAEELVTIGRSASCRIQVQDKSVSREHCVAIYTNGKICINDLRSTHGITYEGERVDRCELSPGDQCHLGSALATFESSETANDKPPQPASAATATQPPARSPLPSNDAVDSASTPDSTQKASSPAPSQPDLPSQPEGLANNSRDDNSQNTATTADPVRAIAGYRILDKLGEGGFGTVYRADQVQLGRQVALKILKHDSANGDRSERIEAFLREARVAAGLDDPHLVKIYDVGESDGEHFLSMELVEGGSLSRKLRRDGPMPWPDVIHLVRDIGHALKAAHAAGLVHRDVKPGNILLTRNGQAKLTDLGLAANDSNAGTIAFMAPEQLRRQTIDARTDIYALGCTAYAALTGSAPFRGDQQEMARAQIQQRPDSLRDRNVVVPWHLQQLIVESMMAKDPSDRPQHADALLDRLDRMILPSDGGDSGPEEDEDLYPNVAPKRLGRPLRPGAGSTSSKAFLARLTGDTIVFTIVGATVIALLLVLKMVWPHVDIYRIIGK